jgi:Raf kinase inhibitor-like YbhB/YbcL family protein
MTSQREERRRLLLRAARAGLALATADLLRPLVAPDLIGGAQAGETFRLQSAAFKDRERIPPRYSCQGEDISPPLSWSGAPAGTESFALVCYDTDAPGRTFYHWAIFDLPASRTTLPEAYPKGAEAGGSRQAVNDFGDNAYGGPCPPPGHGVHHYHFALFAVRLAKLGLAPDVRCPAVEMAAKRQALSTTDLIGLYSIG